MTPVVRTRPARPFVRRLGRGFTLIEMLVVLGALALLLSVAAPAYLQHMERAAEASLRQTLQTVRAAIDQYQADQGRYPEALGELVSTGYLRAVPVDPMTGRADWVILGPSRPGASPLPEAALPQAGLPDSAQPGGIQDLHSASARHSRQGAPYAGY